MSSLTATRTSRVPGAIGIGLVVAVGLAATFDSETDPTFCVFRRCTGGFCPGCGGSRAVVALVRGDVGAAWQLHPWALVLVAQMVVAATMAFAGARRVFDKWLVPAMLANLCGLLAVWVMRLATGSIPVPFA